MENTQKVSCNSLDGIVALPLVEYTRLVRESTCNNIIREFIAEEGKNSKTGYVDGDFIRRILSIGSKEV